MTDVNVALVRQAIFHVLDGASPHTPGLLWDFNDDEQRVDFADQVVTWLCNATAASEKPQDHPKNTKTLAEIEWILAAPDGYFGPVAMQPNGEIRATLGPKLLELVTPSATASLSDPSPIDREWWKAQGIDACLDRMVLINERRREIERDKEQLQYALEQSEALFTRSATLLPSDPGGDLEILRMALGNTAACLGDALATYNRVVGQDVFKNSAPADAASSDDKYRWLLHNGGLLNEFAKNWNPLNGTLLAHLEACVDAEMNRADRTGDNKDG